MFKGNAEIARRENAGQEMSGKFTRLQIAGLKNNQKKQGWKMQDRKYLEKSQLWKLKDWN